MRRIYFDEAKDDSDYPHYHIGAVSIDEAHLKEVEAGVAEIARAAFGSDALEPGTELHAAEIYHRKKHFKEWNDFDARVGLLSRLIDILNLREVELIDIQINCEFLYGSQSPADLAFMFLCEKADELMRAKNCLGMLIGDRESDRLAARYATTLSGYRAAGTGFEYGRQIEHLVDSVHSTHSHLSRLLQLAGVYTWLLQFKARNRGSDNPRHKTVFELIWREDVNFFPAKYKEWPKR